MANDYLRPMIPLEEKALDAGMMRSIILLSTLMFLIFTHLRVKRVAILDFFASYLEGTVIAHVPPYVLMSHNIDEKMLLLQLLNRREGAKILNPMSRAVVKGTRDGYDAVQEDLLLSCQMKQVLRVALKVHFVSWDPF